jgi:hypothetical protein
MATDQPENREPSPIQEGAPPPPPPAWEGGDHGEDRPPAPKSGNVLMGVGGIIIAVAVLGLCVVLAAVLAVVALLVPAVGNVRSAAARAHGSNNLKQLGLAMLSYHDTHKSFPDPRQGGFGKKGKLSWRVAILPYIEQIHLYQQFDLDKDWDDPQNIKLLDQMPALFAVPGEKERTNKTHYQVFTGKNAIFNDNPARRYRLSDIHDGAANTFLIVEGKKPVEWTRPDDLVYDGSTVPELGGMFDGGFHACMADASVWFIRHDQYGPADLRSLIDPNDGVLVKGWPP